MWPWRGMHWRYHRLAPLLLLTSFYLVACHPPLREMYLRPDSLRIDAPSVSPDGKFVAFSYADLSLEPKHRRLALYRVDADRLELLPQPDRLSWMTPSFSPDGRLLTFTSYCSAHCGLEESGFQIATLDLSNGRFRFVTRNYTHEASSPVFAPNGDEIWFVSNGTDDLPPGIGRIPAFYGISSLSLVTGDVKSRLPNPRAPIKFLSIFKLRFLGQQSVILSALGPQDPNGQARSIGIDQINGAAYLLAPNGEVRRLDNPAMTGKVGASVKTGRIAFVDGRYDQDVLVKEMNGTRRITSLQSQIYAPDISADGQTIVFLEDHDRHSDWEVWIVNVDTGDVRKTTVRSKLKELIGAHRPEGHG